MVSPEQLEAVVRARRNFERARAFDRPVLRSLHPDAVLMGYSVRGRRGEDLAIESNQILRSTIESSWPTSFTIRSAKWWPTVDDEWRSHAMDHILNTHQSWNRQRSERMTRGQITDLLDAAPGDTLNVRVGEMVVVAATFAFESSLFAQFFLGDPQTLVTIAAPSEIIAAGFATGIPD